MYYSLLSDLSELLPNSMMWEYTQHLQFFDALYNKQYDRNLLKALLLFKVSRPHEALKYLQLCNTENIIASALLQKSSHIIQNTRTHNIIGNKLPQSLTYLGLAIEADAYGSIQSSIDFLAKTTGVLQINTTPLHLAIEYQLSGAARKLMELYDVNSKDYLGWIPLHWAAWLNEERMLSALIEHGANVDITGNHNEPPIYLAAFNGHKESVEILLINKAKTTIRNTLSHAPIHMASYHEHVDVMSIMLKYGADIEIRSHVRCNTPLHVAAWHGKLRSANYLLDNGCNIEARMINGGTALHRAALNGKTEMIVLLLDKGADINAVDDLGRTPIACAQQNNHWDSYNTLLSRKT